MNLDALILATTLLQATPVAEATPVVGPTPNVRVHFHTPKNKSEARLFVRRGPIEWAFVCAAPCVADLPASAQLRAVLGDHDDEPYDFVLAGGRGGEIDIEARRGGAGMLAGGIVMTSLGGITLLVGVLLTAVSAALSDEAAVRNAGLICIGVGGAGTIGGITLIANRTYEPRVRQLPHESERWAGAKPAAVTPLSLTFAF